MKTSALWLVLAFALAGLAAPQAAADRTVAINTGGLTPFLYGGHSYVPLRSATDFLGAALLWDAVEDRAVVTYGANELGLVLGSTTAYHRGRPIALPAPPLLIDGHMFVPTMVFDRYLQAPVRWESADRRVLIHGPRGWGHYDVRPHPPSHVVPFLRGVGGGIDIPLVINLYVSGRAAAEAIFQIIVLYLCLYPAPAKFDAYRCPRRDGYRLPKSRVPLRIPPRNPPRAVMYRGIAVIIRPYIITFKRAILQITTALESDNTGRRQPGG